MTHYRSSPGIAVSTCGQRGLELKFSIQRKLVDCPVCVERREAGDARRHAQWNKARKATHS